MSGLIVRLHHRDERVLLYVVGRRHPHLDRAMRALTHLGDAAVAIGLVLLMLAAPAVVWRQAGLWAAGALVVSHLAVQLLKRTVVRARPRLPVGIASLVEAPDRFSFPSGHAAAALSVALGLATAVPLLIAPWVLLLGISVGITRCYLGVHYPGDVLVGWLLALTAFTVFASF